MIKKFTILLLAFIVTFSLTGCDEKQTDIAKLLDIKRTVEFENTEVTDNITLPTFDQEGVTASWSSSKEEYISNTGIVTRPSYEEGDKKVFLTLTLELGTDTTTKVFEFTVKAIAQASEIEILEGLINGIAFASMELTSDLTLPSFSGEGLTVNFISTREGYLGTDGVVTRPAYTDENMNVTFTIELTLGEYTRSKTFVFTVIKEETPVELGLLDEAETELIFSDVDLIENVVLPTLTNQDISLTWTSNNSNYLTNEGVVTRPPYTEDDAVVTLTATLTLGEFTRTLPFVFTVTAEERPAFIELTTEFTDALTMDFSYQNLDFIDDGFGEVDLVRCVDGDTAVFSEGAGSFTVRFLGINTPESTYKFEPWGKAASTFTCDKLTNATSIVLEYDPSSEARTDGNGRYLGWVWYDGRLLNLELVEEAYTGSKGVGGSKYETTFYLAEFKTQDTDRRIWGEDDPDFDYSLDGVQITIEELVTNQELYVGLKVVISGVITRQIGGHPYIESNGYGIYLYKGFEYTTKLAEGNEVLISALTLTYYPDAATGAPQLVGFTRTNIEVLSEGNVVTPTTITFQDFDRNKVGSLVEMLNLTVVSVYENTYDDAFTVTATDSQGNTISIRRDGSASPDITADLFVVGSTFDIVAPFGRYNSQYQLMISKTTDLTIH